MFTGLGNGHVPMSIWKKDVHFSGGGAFLPNHPRRCFMIPHRIPLAIPQSCGNLDSTPCSSIGFRVRYGTVIISRPGCRGVTRSFSNLRGPGKNIGSGADRIPGMLLGRIYLLLGGQVRGGRNESLEMLVWVRQLFVT